MIPTRRAPSRIHKLTVLPGPRGRGWLAAGAMRIPCALGPAGVVRIKREGDGGTPAGRYKLLWGYFRPDRSRPDAGGVPLRAMRRDTAWCENPDSRNYNRPVPVGPDASDHMWREDRLYDLTFVLDQNFSSRAKGRGSAIFFHIAREGLTPTAGCVAIPLAAMRRLAPRLARGAVLVVR